MVFNDNNEDELPELPLFSREHRGILPPEDFDSESTHLPSFPDSPSYNRFSQAAIKDAVNSKGVSLGEIPSEDTSRIVEMDEWNPNAEKKIEIPKMSFPPTGVIVEKPMIRDRSKDVFVKIEKFYSARNALAEVKQKLIEIDEAIKKIREVKMREEQELAGWEKEILQVKSRIQEVTGNIFEKVE